MWTTSPSQRIVAAGALSALACLLNSLPAHGSEDSRARRLLDKASTYLESAQWAKAENSASKAADYLIEQSLPTDPIQGLLAESARIQAVAVSELGDRRLAEWYWQVATIIDGSMPADTFLGHYEHAAHLSGAKPRTPEDAASRLPLALVDGFPEPNLRRGAEVVISDASVRAGWTATIEIEIVIDTNGRSSQPILLRGLDAPVFSFPALMALAKWEWDPVLIDGQPTPCRFKITIKMK